MTKALLGVLVAAMMAAPAMAADFPVKTPSYVAPAWSWTGCYVGVHAGGGIHHSDFTYDPEQGGNIGAVAGAQAGCNYQVRQLVVGIEGELYWAKLEAKSESIDLPCCENTERAKNTFDASLALRIGYAFDRLLVYGKVGADWGRFKWERNGTDFTGFGCECTFGRSAEKTLIGLLLSVGFEYAFLDNWTAKLEYNYINFGNPLIYFTCQSSDPTFCDLVDANTVRGTKQIVKVGLNYKFGGADPVYAKY